MPRQIRDDVAAARRARSADSRLVDDRARNQRVLALLAELINKPDPAIACYLSQDDEPGTWDLVAELASRGPVLLPVLRREPDWAWFSGLDDLGIGPFGIKYPTGPRLGADGLAAVDAVLAAGLAASPEGGRIGTGGGWYDRALPYRRPGVPVIVLLNDDEVRPCPQQPHDQPIDWIVTPTRTIRAIR